MTSLAGTSISKIDPGANKNPGLAIATIIGIAAGCFVLLLCIIIACAYFIMKDNKQADQEENINDMRRQLGMRPNSKDNLINTIDDSNQSTPRQGMRFSVENLPTRQPPKRPAPPMKQSSVEGMEHLEILSSRSSIYSSASSKAKRTMDTCTEDEFGKAIIEKGKKNEQIEAIE